MTNYFLNDITYSHINTRGSFQIDYVKFKHMANTCFGKEMNIPRVQIL